MNGKIKFHKANGPAFEVGEVWVACDGSDAECTIVAVRRFGSGKWDYNVTYRFATGVEVTKDAWNFQVRYMHHADKKILENSI